MLWFIYVTMETSAEIGREQQGEGVHIGTYFNIKHHHLINIGDTKHHSKTVILIGILN